MLARRDPAAAEEALRRAVASAPGSARAHADLALALSLQEKLPEAVAEMKKAVALEPRNPRYLLQYGMALYSGGHPSEAVPILQKAVALSPGQAQAEFLLAAAYADSGDERAVAALDRVLKADPENVRARGLYARYLWDGGRVEEGNRVMDEALARFPKEAALHAEYGEQLPLQGKFETAARELEAARLLGDDRYDILVQLGDALWNAGRLDDAQAKFEEAIAREPERAPAHVELGRILYWTGRTGAAIPHLEAAVRARPKSDGLLLVLGRAYAAEGRLDDAERSFRAAVALDGESSVSRIALGQLLAREGKADEARREIAVGKELYDREKKLQFERISRRVKMNLAWENLRHGKPSEALTRFEKMPPDSDVLEGRAAALSRLGRHDEAIRALEKACSLDPENKTARARLSREYDERTAAMIFPALLLPRGRCRLPGHVHGRRATRHVFLHERDATAVPSARDHGIRAWLDFDNDG